MARIVISYRRADSQAIAGRIFDRLRKRFGKTSVFMDIDNIPPGSDFRAHIDTALHQGDVMLVVIGPQWLNPQASGRAGIHFATDWVRIEVETGLRKNIRIIPVLVGGASMPAVEELPQSIEQLAFRNALEVDAGRDFDAHVARLMKAIDNRKRWIVPAVAACAALLLVGVGAVILLPQPRLVQPTPEAVAAKGPLQQQSAAPAVQPLATSAIPRTEPAPVHPPASPKPPPTASPAPEAPASAPAPTSTQIPEAAARGVTALSKPQVVAPPAKPAPPAETTRVLTAIEGESFVLCGQPDFTISMYQPRPNSPTVVSLRRSGMMFSDGLTLQLSPGKPRNVVGNCEVAFVEVKQGFKPIVVLEEQRR